MYFFIEKTRKLSQKFENYNDIYVETIQKFYTKYQLPPLHESGDGFTQGDASDEEIINSFMFIDGLIKSEMDKNNPYYHEPIAHAFFDEDGDLQASDYFVWLDRDFLTMLEEELNKKSKVEIFKDITEMTNSKVWNDVRCNNEVDIAYNQLYEIKDYINNSLTEDETLDYFKLYEAVDNAIDEVINQWN